MRLLQHLIETGQIGQRVTPASNVREQQLASGVRFATGHSNRVTPAKVQMTVSKWCQVRTTWIVLVDREGLVTKDRRDNK